MRRRHVVRIVDKLEKCATERVIGVLMDIVFGIILQDVALILKLLAIFLDFQSIGSR